MKRDTGFFILITVGILLAILLLCGQTTALFNYDLTVALGLQESVNEVGNVGIAYAKGFGFGDTLIYLPLLLSGIIGSLKNKKWGIYTMFGALAVTAYWPMVCLYAVFADRNAIKLMPDKYISYSIILPLITIYGLWGMWYLYKRYAQ
ncbi:hypothetical protein ACFLZ2_01920 [Candidatus Margulisiibacteriota bacterium]